MSLACKPIAIVGDYSPAKETHLATSRALAHSAAALRLEVEHRWVGTDTLARPGGIKELAGCGGIWIAPASPYKSREGALSGIRMAREGGVPLLGTCGGFQHIILEYARNVLGYADAEHEEEHPGASRLFISRLACSLVGRALPVTLAPDSLAARLYGRTTATERYVCNFGVNPDYVDVLLGGALRIAGSDAQGAVRVVELTGHPFFIGTLFVPQTSSTPAAPHPLVCGFVRACAGL